MELKPLLERLEQIPIFRGLPVPALENILQCAVPCKADKDAFIFLQGEPATHLYVLTGGRVKISQVTPEGYQVIHRVAGPWQMIGGVALIGDETYPVSAQAVEECQGLKWKSQTLRELLLRHPQVAANSLRWMIEHVKETQELFSQLATQRVERRLAHVLLRLARQLGQKTADGVLIDFPLSRQDLAEMSGTTLYTASRILSQWKRDGLVESRRERVLIRFPHGLVMIAEDLSDAEASLKEP